MPHGRRAAPFVLALILAAASPSPAAPDDDDPDSLAPGLIARFTADASPGIEAVRLVPDLSWDWNGGAPDVRLPARQFRLVATGSLAIQATGTYRFYVRGEGMESMIQVGGKVVYEGGAGRPASSTPAELKVGYVSLRLEARALEGARPDRTPRLAVDWEGPGFAREGLPARVVYHDPANAPLSTGSSKGDAWPTASDAAIATPRSARRILSLAPRYPTRSSAPTRAGFPPG